MKLSFSKYQGTGNDFILVDNRSGFCDSLTRAQIARICDRRFGVGGDGFILLNRAPGSNDGSAWLDFTMKNYNSDGGECSMCGNGGRALVQFAHDLGIGKELYRFSASDGEHEAELRDGLVHLKMQDVGAIHETPVGFVLDTGSPHLVRSTSGLMTHDVVTEGRTLRHSAMFMPGGINVNFVEPIGGSDRSGSKIFVRTYERGVEDETFSCGTGVIAAAIALTESQSPTNGAQSCADGEHRVAVETRGGSLQVRFEKTANAYHGIWLIGPARLTFRGEIEIERPDPIR